MEKDWVVGLYLWAGFDLWVIGLLVFLVGPKMWDLGYGPRVGKGYWVQGREPYQSELARQDPPVIELNSEAVEEEELFPVAL